jgi:hypothetical protein
MQVENRHALVDSANAVGSHDLISSWFFEVKFTWIVTFVIVVVPFILNGTGLFALLGLIGAALVGIPLTCIFLMSSKKRDTKNLKGIVAITLISATTLFFVFYIDKEIPNRVAVVTSAIESFHDSEGHYPESLSTLMPKYLAVLPKIKPTFIQPDITYQLKGGKPYLAIPSARGDQFAKYEYDFVSKIWKHYQ